MIPLPSRGDICGGEAAMDATDWPVCDSGRSFAAIDFATATSRHNSACETYAIRAEVQ